MSGECLGHQKLVRLWYSRCGHYWFSTCATTRIHPCHSPWQPFAELHSVQPRAEPLGPISLACFGLSHSPPQRFDRLHSMAWHTEDKAAVIPFKLPRKSNRLSQNSNSQLFDSKVLCVEPAGVDFSFLSPEGIWNFILSSIWRGKSRSLEKGIQAPANRRKWEWREPSPDPEITGCGSWNSCDAQIGCVASPLIYSSSGGPGLRPPGLCEKNKFCCLSAFNLKFTPLPKRHVFPPPPPFFFFWVKTSTMKHQLTPKPVSYLKVF